MTYEPETAAFILRHAKEIQGKKVSFLEDAVLDDYDALVKERDLFEKKWNTLFKEVEALEAFLATLPCPLAGGWGDGQQVDPPCKYCGKQWSPDLGTRHYHGTALDAFRRQKE